MERKPCRLKQLLRPGMNVFLEPLFGVQNVSDRHYDVFDCHIASVMVSMWGSTSKRKKSWEARIFGGLSFVFSNETIAR